MTLKTFFNLIFNFSIFLLLGVQLFNCGGNNEYDPNKVDKLEENSKEATGQKEAISTTKNASTTKTPQEDTPTNPIGTDVGKPVDPPNAQPFFIVKPTRTETLIPNTYSVSTNQGKLEWDFGDLSKRINTNRPIHTYVRPGKFKIAIYSDGKKIREEAITVFSSKKHVETAIQMIQRGTLTNSDAEIDNGENQLKLVFGNAAPVFEVRSRGTMDLAAFTDWAIILSEDLKEKGLATQKIYSSIDLKWRNDGALLSIQVND